MAINSDEMRMLLQHKRELEESLAQIEIQVFHEEGSYIKETPCGNVIRGFDSFHDSKLNTEQPKKSRVEVMEERIFSKSSYIFWQKSRDRTLKEDAKKREQAQALMANRGIYMAGNTNGAAGGVGHVKPVNYGTYGSSTHNNHTTGTNAPASNHSSGHTSHKKRHPDGQSHGHKKKKKKRSSSSSSLNMGYSGGGNSHGAEGNSGPGSSVSVNHFDPI